VPAALMSLVAERLRPGKAKLYFDHGNRTLDAHYAPYQALADRLLVQAGFTPGKDLLSLRFEGEHNEPAWRSQLAHPLSFLLPPR